MVGSQGKMMRLKPADIDHIIKSIEQIIDNSIKLQKLQFSKRHKAPDLSTPPDYPTPEKHLKATLEQLQEDLNACLYPLWPEICEILRHNHQDNQLRREVEALINYQYDQREYNQLVSGLFPPQTRYRFGFDNSLITYKENLIRKFRRVKKILEHNQTPEPAETEQKTEPGKEPSKEAAQAYKLYYGTGENQTEIAKIMTRELRRPVSQGQVSKWVNQYKKWAKVNNIPIPEKPTIINMDSNKLSMGKRTDGRGTGDPRHKAEVDPDGDAYE